MALPQKNRLKRAKDFSRVYRSGKRASSGFLVARACLNYKPISSEVTFPQRSTASLDSRFGISISRKVSKRAVVRNRIRRRIQAALIASLGSIKAGWDVVIVVRPSTVQCEYRECLRELKNVLAKLEILDGYS